jgi:hypothetical protein
VSSYPLCVVFGEKRSIPDTDCMYMRRFRLWVIWLDRGFPLKVTDPCMALDKQISNRTLSTKQSVIPPKKNEQFSGKLKKIPFFVNIKVLKSFGPYCWLHIPKNCNIFRPTKGLMVPKCPRLYGLSFTTYGDTRRVGTNIARTIAFLFLTLCTLKG